MLRMRALHIFVDIHRYLTNLGKSCLHFVPGANPTKNLFPSTKKCAIMCVESIQDIISGIGNLVYSLGCTF
jgi:hypothetical protein